MFCSLLDVCTLLEIPLFSRFVVVFCTVDSKMSLSLSSEFKGTLQSHVSKPFISLPLSPESIKSRRYTSLSVRRGYLAGSRFCLERKNKDEKQDKVPVMP